MYYSFHVVQKPTRNRKRYTYACKELPDLNLVLPVPLNEYEDIQGRLYSDVIENLLSNYVRPRLQIPMPIGLNRRDLFSMPSENPATGEIAYRLFLPLHLIFKIRMYNFMFKENLNFTDVARRLGRTRSATVNMMDLDKEGKISVIHEAWRHLGGEAEFRFIRARPIRHRLNKETVNA